MITQPLKQNFLLTQPHKNFFDWDFINTFVKQDNEVTLTSKLPPQTFYINYTLTEV